MTLEIVLYSNWLPLLTGLESNPLVLPTQLVPTRSLKSSGNL